MSAIYKTKTCPQMISIYIHWKLPYGNKSCMIYGVIFNEATWRRRRRSCDHKHTCARLNVFISWVKKKLSNILLNKYIKKYFFEPSILYLPSRLGDYNVVKQLLLKKWRKMRKRERIMVRESGAIRNKKSRIVFQEIISVKI